MMIDTSPWLSCFAHTISSTGPSVSPFRDFFLEMIDADPRNYLPMIASRRLIGTEQDKDGVPKKRTLYVDH